MNKLKVLVTTGGTKVRIDDVRHVGNFSRGRFGFAIAERFASLGAQVRALASKEAVQRHPLGNDLAYAMEVTTFEFYEDFRDSLFRLVEEERPDVIFMAAAVSDWLCATARTGKIESTQDKLTLEFVRAPKLIAELRDCCGKEAFIVGFKLLSGARREVLLEKARAQLATCRLNLVIANDLKSIEGGRHPIDIVTPEGGAIRVEGTHASVANAIVEHVRHRQDVRWSRSEKFPGCPLPTSPYRCYRDAKALLELGRRANLFSGTDGNVSAARLTSGGEFVITPRKVVKKDLTIDDLLQVEYDPDNRVVSYIGDKKPSIDSAVHATLYARFPCVEALLHLHPDAGVFVTDAVTAKAYPCGTIEEADVITDAARTLPNGARFSIELIDHGYLIALESGGAERLLEQWDSAVSAYRAHLEEVGNPDRHKILVLRPVFAFAEIVGVHATVRDENVVSVFLLPEKRGRGLGECIMDALDRKGQTVIAHDRCEVTDYYISHGWRVVDRKEGFAYLLPPSQRHDLRLAGTLCLAEESTERVLLGRRKTGEWEGMCSFPGGRLEEVDGGDLQKTAWRETAEELLVDAEQYAGHDHHQVTTCVATGKDGESGYRVTAHIVIVKKLPRFGSTEEMDGVVSSLFHAPKDHPMSRGTKRVLREALRLLAERRRRR